MKDNYRKFGLLLDPADEEDAVLIKYLDDHQGNKHKNSYSTILRKALELYVKETSK